MTLSATPRAPGRVAVVLATLMRALPLVLALAPFVPTLAVILASPWPETSAQSDPASLELYVRHVARAEVLVGPYSRFGWNHPGPAELLALVPLYEACGERSASLALGAALLNLAAALALVLVIQRRCGVPRALAAAALLGALLARLGPATLGDPWNPYVTILPCALFLVLAASCAADGPARALPALAAVATFLVQSHVAYVPLVGATLVAAAAFRECRPSGSADPDAAALRIRRPERLSRPAIAWAAVITGVLWAPPLIEEALGQPGNLTKIAAFFSAGGRSHGFAEALGEVLRPISAAPFTIATLLVPSTSDQRAVGAGFLTLALVALLPLSASRSARPFERALAGISCVAVPVAIWSVLQIRGPFLEYLLLWISAIGLVGWIAMAGLLRPGARFAHARVVSAGLLATVLVTLATLSNVRRIRVAGERPPMLAPEESVARAARATHDWLRKEGLSRPLLTIESHETWPFALGLALALEKRGDRVSVEPDRVVLFGSPLAETGREDAGLLLVEPSQASVYADRPDAIELAREEQAALFGVRDLSFLSRALLRTPRPGRVRGERGTRGDPGVAADGIFPADGTDWNAEAALILLGADSWVEVQVPAGRVFGVLVSADGNDTYTVSASRPGGGLEELGVLRQAAGFGLRRRPFFSRRLEGCEAVRIAPREGDRSFSIAEVGFLVRPE